MDRKIMFERDCSDFEIIKFLFAVSAVRIFALTWI